MRGCLKDLPAYQWLAVLPQLVSRICHQNEETVRLVKYIIASVVRQYPQQALWIMAAVSKSTVPSRREAAMEIIYSAKKDFSQGKGGNNLFLQFASLIDHLIKLCFHPGQQRAKNINISTEFSTLKRMMPLEIIMPIQQSLVVNLPTYDVNLTDSPSSDIFSGTELPTISGIADEAEILSSLQRPKKVWCFFSVLTSAKCFQYMNHTFYFTASCSCVQVSFYILCSNFCVASLSLIIVFVLRVLCLEADYSFTS